MPHWLPWKQYAAFAKLPKCSHPVLPDYKMRISIGVLAFRGSSAVYRLAFCTTVTIVFTLALGDRAAGNDLQRVLPSLDPFEDPLTVLNPKEKRAEAAEDRITASALYAHGRMLLRREKYAEALRKYQRAWRYDSRSVSIPGEILRLAATLRRVDEYST